MALVLIGVAGALLAPVAARTDFAQANLAPTLEHPFGTDWMGRDMLARTLAGLATSLGVGIVAACASSVIAFVLAAVAALGGEAADAVVSWVIDLVMGIPHIVLLVLVSYALGRGATGVMVGIALTHWPSLARVLRAEILQLKAAPFFSASRALGVSSLRLAATHVVPHVLPQYLVGLVLLFPHAILHEASITFLGFGLSPEQPAIGVILSEAMGYLTAGSWWLAVFPGLALLGTVLPLRPARLGAPRARDASGGAALMAGERFMVQGDAAAETICVAASAWAAGLGRLRTTCEVDGRDVSLAAVDATKMPHAAGAHRDAERHHHHLHAAVRAILRGTTC